MDDYQPKLLHAYITTFISIGLLAISEKANGKVFAALVLGAAVFLGMTCVILWMMAYSDRYDTVVRYIESFIKLDPEQRSALAFHLPALRLRASRGQVGQFFEDTCATGEHIRLFLVDSDSGHTSSKHSWNTAEKPRWAWDEIYDWLVRTGKVEPNSAAGSQSYLWRGTAYQSMMLYWLSSSVPNLNAEDDFTADVRVFALDDHSPTLADVPSALAQGSTHSKGIENRSNHD